MLSQKNPLVGGLDHKLEEPMADKLNPVMDYDEHNKTYDLFLGLVKYGIAGLVVLLILMAIFLL